MIDSHEGTLLVATPRLLDPSFFRTVVLMLQHDVEGTLGLVLNRRTNERVDKHLPEWAGRTADPGLVHYGGPVEPEVAMGLAVSQDGMETGVAGLRLVDLAGEPVPSSAPIQIYSGYAGWGPEQLEDEIKQGSWYVIQASPDDPFIEPDSLWRKVLRRQSGFLSLVSTFPDDVGLN